MDCRVKPGSDGEEMAPLARMERSEIRELSRICASLYAGYGLNTD